MINLIFSFLILISLNNFIRPSYNGNDDPELDCGDTTCKPTLPTLTPENYQQPFFKPILTFVDPIEQAMCNYVLKSEQQEQAQRDACTKPRKPQKVSFCQINKITREHPLWPLKVQQTVKSLTKFFRDPDNN